MDIQKITADFFESNIYLLKRNGKKIMIDCGGPPSQIAAVCDQLQFDPDYILLTHGHIDHILSLTEFGNKAKIFIHSLDQHYLADTSYNLSVQLTGNLFVFDGSAYNYKQLPAELGITVLHTPGHSPGSVCLLIDDCLFSGDTLFCGGIGNTAFPGGDYATEVSSVRKILELPENVTVYPGHGCETTIKQEKF